MGLAEFKIQRFRVHNTCFKCLVRYPNTKRTNAHNIHSPHNKCVVRVRLQFVDYKINVVTSAATVCLLVFPVALRTLMPYPLTGPFCLAGSGGSQPRMIDVDEFVTASTCRGGHEGTGAITNSIE